MNAQALDDEAEAFFDYLLSQKISLYRKLYPHLNITSENWKQAKAAQPLPGNTVFIPEAIQYTDFIMFFQQNIEEIFKHAEAAAQGGIDGGQTSYTRVPTIGLALRLTVEVYRVLSGDQATLTAGNLLDYMNKTQLFPMSVQQLMDLFDIYDFGNLQNYAYRKYVNDTLNSGKKGKD